jgi:purine-cytosine permease-like protein
MARSNVLVELLREDYSTGLDGPVPLSSRRPTWHLAALWTTLAANFSFLFLGVALHAGGYSLPETLGIAVLGCAIYLVYAIPAARLGSETGQTHSLLTRSVFGRAGSWLVSGFILVAPLGWVGFTAGLLAQVWAGLYDIGHLEALTIVFAVVMIAANLFGFVGISAYARYVVAPLMIIWVLWFVLRAAVMDAGVFAQLPAGNGLGFWAAVGSVIGFAMWGNEPDIWRYGRRGWRPLAAFPFAYSWFVVFVGAGWLMAQLSASGDFGPQVRFMTDYSLLGLAPIALLLATISLFAVNDGNYYESVNAGQNLVGALRGWRRQFTCLVLAAVGGLAAYLVNFRITDGWFKVAGFLAITVPCATVIMLVDQVVLPHAFGLIRRLEPIPAWRDTGPVNVPAVIALLVAVGYGTYASDLLFGSGAERYWGPVPLETWVLAGALYAALVALLVRLRPDDLPNWLGFSTAARSGIRPGHREQEQ